MNDRRPSWDEHFMTIAHMIARMSSCDRAHVGAVIVRDRRLIAEGYNGAPAGVDNCLDVGHLMVDNHCVRTCHAEINAIAQCARLGTACEGAVMYVTHFPCLSCMKAMINSGISSILYAEDYRASELVKDFAREAGVSFSRLRVDMDRFLQ